MPLKEWLGNTKAPGKWTSSWPVVRQDVEKFGRFQSQAYDRNEGKWRIVEMKKGQAGDSDRNYQDAMLAESIQKKLRDKHDWLTRLVKVPRSRNGRIVRWRMIQLLNTSMSIEWMIKKKKTKVHLGQKTFMWWHKPLVELGFFYCSWLVGFDWVTGWLGVWMTGWVGREEKAVRSTFPCHPILFSPLLSSILLRGRGGTWMGYASHKSKEKMRAAKERWSGRVAGFSGHTEVEESGNGREVHLCLQYSTWPGTIFRC